VWEASVTFNGFLSLMATRGDGNGGWQSYNVKSRI
jgi:hypothetical protein